MHLEHVLTLGYLQISFMNIAHYRLGHHFAIFLTRVLHIVIIRSGVDKSSRANRLSLIWPTKNVLGDTNHEALLSTLGTIQIRVGSGNDIKLMASSRKHRATRPELGAPGVLARTTITARERSVPEAECETVIY